eukprot:TRINITY_DN39899_c0_g1_i1.p1 TRINITY_DN39899_c0_g1~~TRINITY_DN39899_c0_g1_i1.p1  ORF type:complete len:306 (+),score=121.45 TRINITY_DN39899_c0_g1_i1:22-918(+)
MESVTPQQLEQRLLLMCTQAGPNGIPAEGLKTHLAKYGMVFQTAMQSLLGKKKIEAATTKLGQVVYRVSGGGGANAAKHAKISQLNDLERRVYEAVKAEDTKGVWRRDLKMQLKQFGTEGAVTKATKKLEKELLIKTVKSVANRTRTVYMLYELDPHDSVTGGTWFNEQQFDKDFVNVIYRSVYQIVKDNDQVSLESIERSVAGMEVSRKHLCLDDIQAIVNVLIYDGKLVEVVSEGGGKYYQLATQLIDWHPFAESPCSSCAIQSQCDSGGGEPYNPQTCPYLKSWLGVDDTAPTTG